jgi:hypothetical protein
MVEFRKVYTRISVYCRYYTWHNANSESKANCDLIGAQAILNRRFKTEKTKSLTHSLVDILKTSLKAARPSQLNLAVC